MFQFEEPIGTSSSGKATSQLDIQETLRGLPDKISYSTVDVGTHQAACRDLFDVTFQSLAEDRAPGWLAEPTDLKTGEYEGGFKTWECSLDLAGVAFKKGAAMSNDGNGDRNVGPRILELGAGTGIPICAVYLAGLAAGKHATYAVHDFNEQVLEGVTVPNLLLTYALWPQLAEKTAPEAGEIEVTEELVEAFLHSGLFQVYAGGWVAYAPERYDVVLTSETVYNEGSIGPLVDVMRATGAGDIYVACKTVYFGVGGGLLALERTVADRGGTVHVVAEHERGVKRVVVGVRW